MRSSQLWQMNLPICHIFVTYLKERKVQGLDNVIYTDAKSSKIFYLWTLLTIFEVINIFRVAGSLLNRTKPACQVKFVCFPDTQRKTDRLQRQTLL